ncbi:hypothetical protein [Nostoc sp.]|uniref:hypothetical protein n=1 Tax=Nostoc sp. TaxID=1180 RepID=UPI002FF50404
MTITLTMKEDRELWAEANYNSPQKPKLELFEILHQVPRQLGKGYVRDIEVYPYLKLKILDCEYDDDVLLKIPEWYHPLQFCVLLCGVTTDEYNGQKLNQRLRSRKSKPGKFPTSADSKNSAIE